MRKRLLALALTLAMVLATLPATAMAADEDDFTITDGVLTKYTGAGGDVVIPGGVTSIGNYTFDGYSSLTSVNIPDNVTSIGAYAFHDCTSLRSVNIPNGVTSIGANAFQNCNALTSITIPDSVTSIADFAFSWCRSMTSINIPSGVTSIGRGALEGKSLTEIKLDSSTDNSNAYFTVVNGVLFNSDKTELMAYPGGRQGDYAIPSGVTTIGQRAFVGAQQLTDVTIPSGVTQIGWQAFFDCTSLTSMILPDSINSIGDEAFRECTGLTSIYIPHGGISIGFDLFNEARDPLTDVYFGGKPDDWGSLRIDSSNELLTGATRWYRGEAKIASSTPAVGEANPVVTVTSDRPFKPITDQAAAMNNVTVGAGSTGLTLNKVELGANNKTMLLYFTGSSQGGDITVAINSAAFVGPDGFTTAGAFDVTMPAAPVPEPEPDIPVTPDPEPDIPVTPDPEPVYYPSTPVIPSTPTVTPGQPADTPEIPEIILSPIQEEVIRTNREDIPDWIDRLELPDYARTFYDVMAGNTLESHTAAGKKQGVFEVEQNFVLPDTADGGTAQVEQIEEVEFSLMDMYGDGEDEIKSTIFEDENFYRVTAEASDKAIDYENLKMGSVVRTSAFNGIYVTKIPYDSAFDAKKKTTAEYIAAVYHAFDRDHPEVFWLSGKCKARIATVADPGGGKTAYFFLVMANKDGFTMCASDWTAPGSIASGLSRRDASVTEILKSVTASGTADKIRQLNKWITEHNQYNTTPDLTTIGNEPHECLAALEGRIGRDGPVCDGYSRALKVLCDQLSIPCVLETGWAKPQASSEPPFHMWNLIQVGGTWYGTDITWDDPSVKDVVAAISGRENENYLLVGTDTVINGLAFDQSHVVQNQAAAGGVNFNNGPILSPTAYSGLSIPAFADVPSDAYYYDGVLWAVDRGITTGTSATAFSPNESCTQVQILTFLWRAAGKPASTAQLPFTLNKELDYAETALCWAYQNGMIGADFDQGALCTRANAVKFIWQAEGSPAASGSVFTDVPADADYAQAVTWAVAKKVTEGASATMFAPDQVCTRAQIVTFLCRDRA